MVSTEQGSSTPLESGLTGRFNIRRSLSGKLVLQVEESVVSPWPWSRAEKRRRWRDARALDLASPEMRALVDLRAMAQDPGRSQGRPSISRSPDILNQPRSPRASLDGEPRRALVS